MAAGKRCRVVPKELPQMGPRSRTTEIRSINHDSRSEASAFRRRLLRRRRGSGRDSESWRSAVTASAPTTPGGRARRVSPQSRTVSGVSPNRLKPRGSQTTRLKHTGTSPRAVHSPSKRVPITSRLTELYSVRSFANSASRKRRPRPAKVTRLLVDHLAGLADHARQL
jgi:hypothetical protein